MKIIIPESYFFYDLLSEKVKEFLKDKSESNIYNKKLIDFSEEFIKNSNDIMELVNYIGKSNNKSLILTTERILERKVFSDYVFDNDGLSSENINNEKVINKFWKIVDKSSLLEDKKKEVYKNFMTAYEKIQQAGGNSFQNSLKYEKREEN